MSTIDDEQIENLLHHPPRPHPPTELKARLITQTKSPQNSRAPDRRATPRTRTSWLQQWWRVLAPTGVFLVCLFVLAAQQQEIRSLKQSIQTLTAQIEGTTSATGAASTTDTSSVSEHNPPAAEVEEIARLKETISRLSTDISQLEQLRQENQKLRTELSTPSPSRLSADEVAAMDDQRASAMRNQCCNNMKQVGLAAHMWANDNNNVFPPDILSLTNLLKTPKLLCCPADSAHSPVASWSAYTDANCSYEYLAPSAPGPDGSNVEPNRVLFRCPIHGNLGMGDGSVLIEAEKKNPEQLIRRDGKLYFDFR